MEPHPTTVAYSHADRQWDARFNVQQDRDVERLLCAIQRERDLGKFKYILVGGIEIGTRPYQDDYKVRHVHVAAIFNNRCTKSAILKNWEITEGNGYYLVPRNRDLPYSGWKNHHIKAFSKINPDQLSLFEDGELPEDDKKRTKSAPSEEEKKRKIDDILIDMQTLIREDKEEEAFIKYPRNYLIYGERLKARITQRRDFFHENGDPHIWLYGLPGTGKTAILSYIYPKYFKKNLHNKFFDLYDPKIHDHIMLEDLDHEAIDRLSINFVKTLCDEQGFAIDQKYKTPQLSKTKVLVTSNFTIPQLLTDGLGCEQNVGALMRRFWHVNIYELLRVLGLKIIPKLERWKLKKDGNTDVRKIFICWDYVNDLPKGEQLKEPSQYQTILRETYYA